MFITFDAIYSTNICHSHAFRVRMGMMPPKTEKGNEIISKQNFTNNFIPYDGSVYSENLSYTNFVVHVVCCLKLGWDARHHNIPSFPIPLFFVKEKIIIIMWGKFIFILINYIRASLLATTQGGWGWGGKFDENDWRQLRGETHFMPFFIYNAQHGK